MIEEMIEEKMSPGQDLAIADSGYRADPNASTTPVRTPVEEILRIMRSKKLPENCSPSYQA